MITKRDRYGIILEIGLILLLYSIGWQIADYVFGGSITDMTIIQRIAVALIGFSLLQILLYKVFPDKKDD